ncbi:hypothetical protein [Corynebacterium efficiens YS-314]|uniref:Uncharacterized protein n=1 Tax=Corynebacterium efficiens (strain DSM 44549 / YS-314 / AJ 12310 / JCM 11189 / NBRC 100395) TaxID=196164 RepID=Q8FSD9_COREF|nr:hypothetical protein [Corynebacterium efficiens YS-314]
MSARRSAAVGYTPYTPRDHIHPNFIPDPVFFRTTIGVHRAHHVPDPRIRWR